MALPLLVRRVKGERMKLYSGPLSLFTAKVRIALAEKGLDYERVEVSWSRRDRYEPHHPDVVAINPKRQVPCLVDGDLEIYDSTLIVEYLEDRHPRPPLMPAEPGAKARCRLLELEADEVLFPHVWTLITTGFYPDGGDTGRSEAEAGVRGYQHRLAERLRTQPHLCGDFSTADIANFVMLFAASTLGVSIPAELPTLATWAQRVAQRPSVAADAANMAVAATAS
jgi:glutathione S-transferase